MIKAIRTIIQVLHILSFCVLMLSGLLGLVYEIIGHAKFLHILSLIGISNGFQLTEYIGGGSLLLLIFTHFIKEKF